MCLYHEILYNQNPVLPLTPLSEYTLLWYCSTVLYISFSCQLVTVSLTTLCSIKFISFKSVKGHHYMWIDQCGHHQVLKSLVRKLLSSVVAYVVKCCGVFAQTVAKQQLRKQISTERLFSIRSASRTLLHNAEVTHLCGS
jgi:hypothetical protein